MEQGNNTILDFVSSAVEYLSSKIPEVAKELDVTHENSLEDIKKELDKRVSSVLDKDQDGELDFVTEGKEIFSNIKEKKNDLIGEFEEIFDVDFGNDKKDLEIQTHLLDLLKKKDDDFIEDEFDIIAKNASSNNEEEVKEDIQINKITGGNEDKLDDIFSEIINNEDNEGNEVIETKEEIDINEAILEEPIEEIEIKEPVVEEPLDEKQKEEIVEEITKELEENKLVDIIDEAKKEVKEDKVEPIVHFKRPIVSVNESDVVINLQEIIGPVALYVEKPKPVFVSKEEAVIEEPKEEKEDKVEPIVHFKRPIKTVDVDDVVINLQEIIGEVKPVEIKVKDNSTSTLGTNYSPSFITIDDRPISEIFIRNPGTDESEDINPVSIMRDIYDSINEGESIDVINIGNSDIASGEDADNDYIENLLDELNSKNVLETIEKARQEEEEERNKVYNAVKEIYPYLDNTFIKSVYDMKGSIAYEYPENKNIIILHRLKFNDLENLRSFVEVMMSHDYLVNVDEKKKIVDVFRSYINTDGLVLANIFEVASQAKLLEGEYEGYRVILEGEQI